MDEIIKLFVNMDIGTVVVIAASFYFFNLHLNKKFDKIDARFEKIDARFDRIDARFEKIDARFDRIDARFEKIESRIIGIEHSLIEIKTMLHMKECCALNNQDMKKEAQ
ncbi:hypothetical protein UFOVP256_46 [uncultured Caudovirales phage]|uniref:Uncharacterized protein n=1 Tax=uncultured Caudovirales phage TaxID=2100421 RepID=A0A6J5LHK6_9CAUD|nr:hypothetical protein UFOVP256_46 [uncultured Caudovirales phage]